MTTTIAHRMATAAILAASVVATGTACSSSAAPTPTASLTPRTPAVASADANASSPAAEALAAYGAMWKDVAEASNTADSQAPYLSDHLSGQPLATITANLAAENKQGIVAHGAPVLHAVVTSVTATTVKLSDCTDDRAWLQVLASTSKPVNDIPGGFRATTATVTDLNGTWKVTQLYSGADGTCHLTQ